MRGSSQQLEGAHITRMGDRQRNRCVYQRASSTNVWKSRGTLLKNRPKFGDATFCWTSRGLNMPSASNRRTPTVARYFQIFTGRDALKSKLLNDGNRPAPLRWPT